jgi:response regulator of citrate/malate metabolism
LYDIPDLKKQEDHEGRQTMSVFGSVLLVDDDMIANHLHKQLINKHNIASQVFIKTNSKAAYDFIKDRYHSGKSLPSLIILDIDMPVKNGFEFLSELLNSDLLAVKNIPLAILTNSAHSGDIEKIRELGNFVYITKPLTDDKMFEMIERTFSY